MLLGFKQQFETYVEEGSKTHSVRAKGGREWKVGVVADCFVNPRQKTMRLLGRFPVVKVEDISIRLVAKRPSTQTLDWLEISIAGRLLDDDEAIAFAWRDGFRSGPRVEALARMAAFWRKENGLFGVWEGELIHWQYSKALAGRLATKAASRAAARALGVAA